MGLERLEKREREREKAKMDHFTLVSALDRDAQREEVERSVLRISE